MDLAIKKGENSGMQWEIFRDLVHRELKGGGGCSFGFGFQEPFNGDSISSLIKSFYFTLYLIICQLHRSGSALNCG